MTYTNTQYRIDDEYKLYFDKGYTGTRLIWSLIAHAEDTINNVYIFKNFDEYCRQLESPRPEDKNEVYWNGSFHERLIDRIKLLLLLKR